MSLVETILIVDMMVLSIIYISFIGLIFFPRDNKNTRFSIPLSIIIPAHNEEQNIEKTLRSIISTTYLNKLEVILVDDGSTDKTGMVTKNFSHKNNFPIKIIETTHIGKANAVEFALNHIKNDVFVMLDADTEIQTDSLTELIQPFNNKKVAAVSATIRVKASKNILTWFQDVEYAISSCSRLILDNTKGTCIIPGFCAIRKSAINYVGGFRGDTVTEDYDICLYFKKAGYEIRMMSNAIAFTTVPQTWNGLTKQRIRWFRGIFQVISKHKDILFKKRFPSIGLFQMPIQIFWILHAFVYVPAMFYLIFDGYWKWFGSTGDYFSTEAVLFFIKWFVIYGMMDFIYNVGTSQYPLTLYNFMIILVFTLSYCLISYSIIKFSKPNITTLFVILFFFPYTIFQLSLYIASMVYQITSKKQESNWEKIR